MVGYYNNDEATDAVLQDRWLKTGDLGRLDEDGNLFIVGRSKDVIIDSNGKNIYPDEIEDLYGKSPFIKEMSVVGLPDDDGGEKIAALVVPDYEHDIALVACRGEQEDRGAFPRGLGRPRVLQTRQGPAHHAVRTAANRDAQR